jgi:hypothetical protein
MAHTSGNRASSPVLAEAHRVSDSPRRSPSAQSEHDSVTWGVEDEYEDDEGPRGHALSPTSSELYESGRQRTGSPSLGGSGSAEKKRALSAIPRLRNALAHVHLPPLSRQSSFDTASIQSSSSRNNPRTANVGNGSSDEPLFVVRTSTYGVNNDESRRPSYASVNTRSSVGSRQSQQGTDDTEDHDDPSFQSLQPPLDLSQLSSQADAPGARNFSNARPNPVSLPDPVSI